MTPFPQGEGFGFCWLLKRADVGIGPYKFNRWDSAGFTPHPSPAMTPFSSKRRLVEILLISTGGHRSPLPDTEEESSNFATKKRTGSSLSSCDFMEWIRRFRLRRHASWPAELPRGHEDRSWWRWKLRGSERRCSKRHTWPRRPDGTRDGSSVHPGSR